MNRDDYKLVQTSSACPEQYDVFLDGKQVGYLRLRYGSFSADYVTFFGGYEPIYSANTKGDGMFEYDERTHYLNEAVAAIDKRHHNPSLQPAAVQPIGWALEDDAPDREKGA